MRKLLMTSMALVIFAISLTLFQLSSCTKTDAEAPINYPIEGLWIGTYTIAGLPALGEQYFSLIIKPDGTMINDTKYTNQQNLSIGTWTLNGTTLSCTFTNIYGQAVHLGVQETTTSTWDKTGKLSGTWQNVGPQTGSGTIKLTRVN